MQVGQWRSILVYFITPMGFLAGQLNFLYMMMEMLYLFLMAHVTYVLGV
jgi:hypothetical protein